MTMRRGLATVLGINQALTWGMSFYLPAILAQPAADALGVDTVAILGAYSWSLVVSGLCAPKVGKWIDRKGGRGALLVSILVIALGQAVLAISHDMVTWYVGWTIIGFGMSMGLYDAAFATVGALLGREAGPTITGITLIAGFASTIFWTLGAALIGTLGWRGLMLLYVGIMLGMNLPMVWAMVPHVRGRGASAPATAPADADEPARAGTFAAICLAGFFTLRWLITAAISVHILTLMQGIGLPLAQAVLVGAMIGPGQVAGRIVEWTIGNRIGLLTRARAGALLFPLGAVVLFAGGPTAAIAFALLYGMSNGILTINRGTLPLAMFGARGYATMLGWFALPVQLAQALAPTLSAPLVDALPPLDVLLIAGGLALLAACLLLPLRLPAR